MKAPIDIHPPLDSLKAFSLGLLDDASAQALYRHLETCPACRRQAEAASGDDFLFRLQRARDSRATPASARDTKASGWPSTVPPDPAKSLASGRGIPVGQTTLPHLPPELTANEQYEVIRELGRGGMGVVYLARNKQMDRLEVLKVVNPAMLDRPDMVERFLREIRSAAALEHQNVVRAYSCLHMGKLLALVMQYVEGEDLARLVERRGPLSVSAACASAVQVARGLQEACKKGMVHRDIKPQNLLLSLEIKQVMILDFGLAKIASEKGIDAGLTGDGQMLGTPAYMAPEQSLDAAKADIRADIYSLGCTLYFLLTGEPPFKGKSLFEILQAHQSTLARPLNEVRPEVPTALAEVVAKMMAKDPAQRYQTPTDVVSALAPFAKQGAKSATPKSPSPLAPGVGRTDSMVGKTSGMGPVAVTHVGKKNEQATVIAVGNPPEVCATLIEPKATSATTKSARDRKRSPTAKPAAKKMWIIGAGIVALALLVPLVWLAAVLLRVETPNGTLIVEMNDDEVEARIKGGKLILSGPDGKVRYTLTAKDRNKKLDAGEYKIRVEGADGLVLDTPEFTMKKGDEVKVRVTLQPMPAGKIHAYEHGGKWRIEGDELSQGKNDLDCVGLVFGDPSWTDYDVTVEVQRTSGTGKCWVCFRITDWLNHFAFETTGTQRAIIKKTDGSANDVGKNKWTDDGKWHTMTIQVRGDHIHCSMDGEKRVFNRDDEQHPRGYVGLVTQKLAARFRNLKITDSRGRILLDGVRNLNISNGTSNPGNDKVSAGSSWTGILRQIQKGKDITPRKSKLTIQKREGTRFEGEYWNYSSDKPNAGMTIAGNVDPMGNITWRATGFIIQGGLDNDNLTVLVGGVVKGKRIRAYVIFPSGLIAEATSTLDE